MRDFISNMLLLLLTGAWIAGGFYMGVDVVIDMQEPKGWPDYVGLFILLNLSAAIVFSGADTGKKILNEHF